MIRLDRLQDSFYGILQQELPDVSVLWTYGQPTGNQLKNDIVALRLLSGPSLGNQSRVRGVAFFPPASILLTIPTATEGALYKIGINGYGYGYNAVLSDTVNSIRDALLALLSARSLDSFIASPTLNPGEILLTPKSFGSIWYVRKSHTIDLTTLVLEEDTALFTPGLVDAVVEVQTYSKNTHLWSGAPALANRILDLVQRTTIVSAFGAAGVGFTSKGSVADISALSGPNWETRASLSLGISMLGIDVERIETFDNVVQSFSVLDGENVVVGQVSVTAQ